jgi:hypothetical protein
VAKAKVQVSPLQELLDDIATPWTVDRVNSLTKAVEVFFLPFRPAFEQALDAALAQAEKHNRTDQMYTAWHAARQLAADGLPPNTPKAEAAAVDLAVGAAAMSASLIDLVDETYTPAQDELLTTPYHQVFPH